ncbi:MAG: hypothetical protein RLY16_857 [Bacteroidota bacterium]|jgi:hypothetical protein
MNGILLAGNSVGCIGVNLGSYPPQSFSKREGRNKVDIMLKKE